MQDIVIRTDTLASMPRIGRKVTEIDADNVHELLPYSYRLINEIRDDNVFILAVIHQRRELQPDLIERSGD